jgi:chorismate mutase/prephenate dehydrogenase
MEMLMTARHFAQSPDLYASIQMNNPETANVTAAFRDAAEELQAIIKKDDHEGVGKIFSDVRGYFGSFTDEALEASSYMIDRLVERG